MPVPVAAMAERHVVERLRDAGAISPATAQPLDGLNFVEHRRLGHLVRSGVVTVTTDGTYFVDLEAWMRHLAARRRRAMIALAVVIGVLLITGLILIRLS